MKKEKHYTIKQRRNPETPLTLANKMNLSVAIFESDRECMDFRTVIHPENFKNKVNVSQIIDPYPRIKREAKSSLSAERYNLLTTKGRFDICNLIKRSSGYLVLYMKFDDKQKEWYKESEFVPDYQIVKINQLN